MRQIQFPLKTGALTKSCNSRKKMKLPDHTFTFLSFLQQENHGKSALELVNLFFLDQSHILETEKLSPLVVFPILFASTFPFSSSQQD
jgi:hypothetical protein